VTAAPPNSNERLYGDAVFPTSTDYCETYGRDLLTGGAVTRDQHAAHDPAGRAVLRGAPYVPALEEPDDDYPLRLATGRTVYHFHTRTKTGRARELEAAAPGAWVELAAADAEALGIADGEPVRVESRRGWIAAPARIERTRPREGTVFVPFHYGYWDAGAAGPDDDREPRAANELTLTWWDPVSKQPMFKTAAVRVRRVEVM
jgi:anaerobic selenocysteine-containing dehydrogenase